MMRTAPTAFVVAALLASGARAGDPLDDIADQFREMTRWQSEDGNVSFDVDVYLTMDNWVMSQPPPGIIERARWKSCSEVFTGQSDEET